VPGIPTQTEGALRSPPAEIERHSGDLARLVFALVVAFVGLLVLVIDAEAALGISLDVLALLDWVPDGLAEAIVGTIQLVAVVAPVVLVGVLVWRRQFHALAVVALAIALGAAAMAMVNFFVDTRIPKEVVQRANEVSFLTDAEFPTSEYLAGAAAAVVALAPWSSRRWRRAGWLLVVLVAFCRIVTATEVPMVLWPALALGSAAGSLALLALGAPTRRPDAQRIIDALGRSGFTVTDVEPLEIPARTSQPYRVATANGSMFVKVMTKDERKAELLIWIWRNIRVKGIEDVRPMRSPRRSLEREALTALFAGECGARVPHPVLVGEIGEASALAAFEPVEGATLAAADSTTITDGQLEDLWTQVARLQDRRIAHGWLNAGNVLVDHDDHAWVTGFSYAEPSATDQTLATDVAELLTSLALLVGPKRAVRGAVAALGRERVASVLPLLQPLALTSETRGLLQHNKKFLEELRTEVQAATGAEEFHLTKIERIGVRSILMVIATVAVVYIMLVQFSEADDIGTAIENADWFYIVPILLFAASTYFAAALSLVGAVTHAIPYIRTTVVQLGQTFLNRFTPCNAGGMALRVRYLQKRGINVIDGSAAVGLTSAASGVMQVALFLVFFLAAGTDEHTTSISLPDVSTVALILLIILVISGAVFLTPWGRRVLLAKVIEILRTAVHTIGTLARNPWKMAMLFGGAGLSKLGYIAAFQASCLAFGIDLPFATIGAVYLTATTIGSAVPTPGGVGGIEAALTACLTAVGVDSSQAVPAMLLFRGITYWLPVIPGYIAFWYLQRVEAV
jgi:undecaprenyl-diphosphatase